MNNAALNTFEVNGELLDSDQRSAVVADVVAQVLFNPKTFRRAELYEGCVSASADVQLSPRVIRRVAVEIFAEASVSQGGRSQSRSPVLMAAMANLDFYGDAFAATPVYSPVVIVSEARVSASPRMRASGSVSIDPEAFVSASSRSYSRVRSPTAIDSSIELWVSVGTLQRIPFYEYAVEERTIKVPQSDRKVMVT